MSALNSILTPWYRKWSQTKNAVYGQCVSSVGNNISYKLPYFMSSSSKIVIAGGERAMQWDWCEKENKKGQQKKRINQ